MRRKYAKDYRLDYVLTPHGNLKPVPVYSGSRFRYTIPDEDVRRLRRQIGLLAVASLLLLLAMLLNTQVLDRDFRPVAIPIGFCMLPTVLLLLAWHTFFKSEPPLTRQQHDKVTSHIPICALFQLILAALALLGLLLQMLLRGFALSWLLLSFGALALTLLSAQLLRLAKRIETEALPNEDIYGGNASEYKK